MADQATKKTTKPKVAKKEPTHPKYSEMVISAITALKERTGSSRQAILKYIIATYNLDEKVATTHVRRALVQGVVKGLLKQVKGTGANGSFRVVKQKPEPKKPKKTVEKKAAKKPTKKDATKSKKVKKPTTKKSAEKKATTKKATAKKPAAKKPAAKKPAAKKAPAKKAPAKKPASKKPNAKKPATKKPATKK